MRKTIFKAIIPIALIIGLVTAPMSVFGIGPVTGSPQVTAAAKAPVVAAPEYLKVSKDSDTALKLSWAKVKDASGYEVYRSAGNANKFQKVKTLKGNKNMSWTNTKLKKSTVYKYKVKAYKSVSGKKVTGSFSYYVTGKTYVKSDKAVNVKSVKILDANRLLGTGAYGNFAKTDDITIVSSVKGKGVLSKKIRWFSSDPSVVKASQSGALRAQGIAGSCYIYAVAHSGAYAKFKVTVGDYAHPAAFSNIDKADKIIADALTNYKDDICGIAAGLETRSEYLIIVYDGNKLLYQNSKEKFISKPGYITAETSAKIENLLKNSKLDGVAVTYGWVTFISTASSAGSIGYIGVNLSAKRVAAEGAAKLAAGWYYIK